MKCPKRKGLIGPVSRRSVHRDEPDFDAEQAILHAERVVQRLAPVEEKTVGEVRDLIEALRVLADRRAS